MNHVVRGNLTLWPLKSFPDQKQVSASYIQCYCCWNIFHTLLSLSFFTRQKKRRNVERRKLRNSRKFWQMNGHTAIFAYHGKKVLGLMIRINWDAKCEMQIPIFLKPAFLPWQISTCFEVSTWILVKAHVRSSTRNLSLMVYLG